jgi:hypothetical protein
VAAPEAVTVPVPGVGPVLVVAGAVVDVPVVGVVVVVVELGLGGEEVGLAALAGSPDRSCAGMTLVAGSAVVGPPRALV